MSSAMLGSMERICQLYLRGRCQRENCDFKHDPEKLKAAPVMAFKSPAPNAPSKNNAPPSCQVGRTKVLGISSRYVQ